MRDQRNQVLDPLDMPVLNMKQAARVWGWCKDTFKDRYRRYLSDRLPSIRTTRGLVFRAVDVFHAAYPEASETTVHLLAHNFIQQLYREREERRERQASSRKRRQGSA